MAKKQQKQQNQSQTVQKTPLQLLEEIAMEAGKENSPVDKMRIFLKLVREQIGVRVIDARDAEPIVARHLGLSGTKRNSAVQGVKTLATKTGLDKVNGWAEVFVVHRGRSANQRKLTQSDF